MSLSRSNVKKFVLALVCAFAACAFRGASASDDIELTLSQTIYMDSPGAYDFLGYGIRADEDNDALISVAYAKESSNSANAVVVYEKDSDGTWTQKQVLTGDDSESGDFFAGYKNYYYKAVGISNGIIVVGAKSWSSDDYYACGAAYIFEKDSDSGNWTQVQKLTGSSKSQYFGLSADVKNGTIIVKDSNNKVYIYRKSSSDDSSEWELVQTISCYGSVYLGENEEFICGTKYSSSQGTYNLYEPNDDRTKWTVSQTFTIKNSGGSLTDFVVRDDVMVLGFSYGTTDSKTTGKVYIFEKIDGSWEETASDIVPDSPSTNGYGSVGYKVTAVGGSSGYVIFADGYKERGWHVYQKTLDEDVKVLGLDGYTTGYSWSQVAYLDYSDVLTSFSYAYVGLDAIGNQIFIGDTKDSTKATYSGAIKVYDLPALPTSPPPPSPSSPPTSPSPPPQPPYTEYPIKVVKTTTIYANGTVDENTVQSAMSALGLASLVPTKPIDAVPHAIFVVVAAVALVTYRANASRRASVQTQGQTEGESLLKRNAYGAVANI
jgi:hypothetical protein